MTTIRDIARLTGYSISTVSRVLNHQNYVSDHVRHEIQQVMDQLDYAPNAVARDLSRGKTQTIGVVLPHSDHPYFTQLIHGIMKAAFVHNYHVILLPSRYDAELEQQYLENLREQAYDALIFTSHGLPLAELAAYQKYGPIIICENPQTSGLKAAYTHRRATYEQALQLFKQRGCESIGLLLSRPATVSATSQATLAAYQAVFHRQPMAEQIITDVTTPADGQRAGQSWIANGIKLDAVLANGDEIALGLRDSYLSAGQPVPELIGQECQLAGAVIDLPTIDHHFEQVGHQAVTLALNPNQDTIGLESTLILHRQLIQSV